MNVQRRVGIGVLVLGLAVGWMGAARGQVLKQVPADADVVVKINNPEAVAAKVTGLAQKLGVAAFVPQLGDPLGTLMQMWGLKEGIDTKGEVAVVMLAPSQGGNRFLILAPVSDYAGFLKNLANVKTEGELTTFNMPGDNDAIYVANRGTHAAISPWKSAVSAKPAGIEVAGAAAGQLQGNDVVMFVNVKGMSGRFLVGIPGWRDEAIQEAEGVPANLRPVVKAAGTQLFNFAEHVLKEGQSATLGLSLSEKGITFTGLAEFESASYLGQTIASIKSSGDQGLLAGLPARKYFAFGGAVMDPAAMGKIMDDMLSPVRKTLENVEEAKNIVAMLVAVRGIVEGANKASFGWAAPAAEAKGPPAGQQLMVISGDAKKVQAGVRSAYQSFIDLLKLIPEGQGAAVQAELKPDAKTVDGASLDQLTMQLKVDANTPQGAQAAQIAATLFGPEGSTTLMGPVSDQVFVSVSGDDELVNAAVAAAKKADDALGQLPNVKAVAEALPKNRAAVLYIAIDNIVMEGLKYAAQMGMPIPLKLPPDMPPIGVSFGTEGSAVRADVHLSADLISNLMSAGMQVMPMLQGGGPKPKPEAP